MLEGSPAAAQFIDTIIDAKLAGTEIEPDIRKHLHQNLLDGLEASINMAVIQQLDSHQRLELEHLIDANKVHEIEPYLIRQGINVTQVIAAAMAEYQVTYLGA